jgi:hypothetical protein
MPKQNKKQKLSGMKVSRPARRAESVALTSLRRQAPVAEPYQAPQPSFRAKAPKEGSACYAGVDYVGNVGSSSSAASVGLLTDIYPTNANFCPRLAAIADVYLRYKWKKIILHFIGKSASTQAGAGAFSSLITDGSTSGITVNTEAIIKNTQGCLVVKGWESGRHRVDVEACGLKWYNTDNSANNQIGGVVYYIPQTTANNDLSWDYYVEYEIEFDEAVAAATVNLLRTKRADQEKQRKTEVCDIEDLGKQLKELQERLKTWTNAT